MAINSTDPVVFARDERGDLVVPLRIATGLEAAVILVRTVLKLWKGELFLNLDAGTPWLETSDGTVTERDAILGQPFDAPKLARTLRPVILGVSLVRSVSQFASSFDEDARNLTVSCVIKTDFGDAPVTATISV